MVVALDAQRFQTVGEVQRGGLAGVAGDDHAPHIQAEPPEHVDEPEHVLVVGDAQIPPDLVLLDVRGVDDDDDLHLVAEGAEHLHLAVGLEPGQHPGRMIVVKELAAELQIELAAEGADPLADVLGLELHILVVVKTDLLHVPYLPKLLHIIYNSAPQCKNLSFFREWCILF